MKKPFKKWPRKCSARNCRGIVGCDEHSPLCHKHRLKKWKSLHPISYAWGHLKRRARARGIKFTLTKGDYAELSKGIDLTKMEHRTTLSLTIDRTDASLGYHKFNCVRASLSVNDRRQYIPYWSGGVKPEHTPEEIRHLNVAYRADCEKLSDKVGAVHPKGSEAFWQEFHRRKILLFEEATA